MEFIRKHTEGQWIQRIYNEHMVISPKDHVVVARCGIGEISVYCDSILISQAPTMLDYLIERAEKLNDEVQDEWVDEFTEHRKQELSRLIEIIKAAGVEVVE